MGESIQSPEMKILNNLIHFGIEENKFVILKNRDTNLLYGVFGIFNPFKQI